MKKKDRAAYHHTKSIDQICNQHNIPKTRSTLRGVNDILIQSPAGNIYINESIAISKGLSENQKVSARVAEDLIMLDYQVQAQQQKDKDKK